MIMDIKITLMNVLNVSLCSPCREVNTKLASNSLNPSTFLMDLLNLIKHFYFLNCKIVIKVASKKKVLLKGIYIRVI